LSVKKGYNRYFIIFQEEDKGYGIAIDKQPTGYAKIEVKNGKCKITVYAQNIKKEKGPYNFCMIDTNRSPANLVKLGEVRIDDVGTGETYWEYNEDNVCDSGNSIENYNVAVLMAESDVIANSMVGTGTSSAANEDVNVNADSSTNRYVISAPLSGYTGKERITWKEKIHMGGMDVPGENTRAAVKAGINKQALRNETPELTDEMIEELDDEGMKFKEYEAAIRNEADRMSKIAFEQENPLQTDYENIQMPDAQAEDGMNIYEFGTEQDLQRHNKHGHKSDYKNKKQHYCCDNDKDDYDYDYNQSSHDHNGCGYEHNQSSYNHNGYGYEYDQSSDDHNGCGCEHNQSSHDHNGYGYEHDQSSDDHNGYGYEHDQRSDDQNGYNYDKNPYMSHKHKSNKPYADIFHHLLQEFEEMPENFVENEMDRVRWWKIPYKYDAKLINEKHYPFMCTIFHLSMAYPRIDYIKYFYRTGHYYFGIKYDENNEVKYLMYGIVGNKDIKDQPYMGMTGFNKWVVKPNKEMGVWIMFYNPKTGNIMVEKNK
jgi:hypothetical protein